jgi:hypothetical protein
MRARQTVTFARPDHACPSKQRRPQSWQTKEFRLIEDGIQIHHPPGGVFRNRVNARPSPRDASHPPSRASPSAQGETIVVHRAIARLENGIAIGPEAARSARQLHLTVMSTQRRLVDSAARLAMAWVPAMAPPNVPRQHSKTPLAVPQKRLLSAVAAKHGCPVGWRRHGTTTNADIERARPARVATHRVPSTVCCRLRMSFEEVLRGR